MDEESSVSIFRFPLRGAVCEKFGGDDKIPGFGVILVETLSGSGSMPSGLGVRRFSGLSNLLLCELGMTISPPSPGCTSVR